MTFGDSVFVQPVMDKANQLAPSHLHDVGHFRRQFSVCSPSNRYELDPKITLKPPTADGVESRGRLLDALRRNAPYGGQDALNVFARWLRPRSIQLTWLRWGLDLCDDDFDQACRQSKRVHIVQHGNVGAFNGAF